MSIRVRFAPSPTGHIHVGNVRTALFNYLFTKREGGKFILRIEDTDLERSSLASEELIYEDLAWLGLECDEGPKTGGDYGPYRQTERFDIYQKCTDELLDKGYAYKCFCTREELDSEREKAQSEGRAYIYGGKCAKLTKEDVAMKESNGEKASIRFRAFKPNALVRDMIHGDISFPTSAFGDFIIVRPDGTPIYNYVVVVDDMMMKITHVVRGDDHLSNTPKQVLVYEALGFDVPTFAHIPMILGPDRSKLSKRHGNTSVEQFRDNGYLPEAMINYMALLSWSGEGERELYTMDELQKIFDLGDVSKSAAVFDFDKLNWMNGIYIRQKSSSEILELCVPYLKVAGLVDDKYVNENRDLLEKRLMSVRDNFVILSDAPQYMEVYFKPAEIDDDAKAILELDTTKPVLEAFISKIVGKEFLTVEEYKSIMKEIQSEVGVKGKPLFMAVRVGVTGATKGPEMDNVATLLSVAELTERVNNTITKL